MVIFIKRPFLMILFAVVTGQISVSGQQNSVVGRIVDAITKEQVKFAHVENYSRHVTTFTDTSGFFTLQADTGDTLVLSAIGYFYKMIIVTDLIPQRRSMNIFELSERIYELSEANIYIPGTYKEFKHDYLNLKIPQTQSDILGRELATIAGIEGKKAYEEAKAKGELPGHGMLAVPILSADEKARIRLKKTLGEEEKQNLIYEKYNAEIVKKVTELKDEDEILLFMLFCDFDKEYLLEVNPLDLIEKITEKFEEYKKKNT